MNPPAHHLLMLLFVASLQSDSGLASVQDSWVDYLQDKVLRVLDFSGSDSRTKRGTKQPPNALIEFEDCGEEDDAFVINYVTVDPNPVVFPGNMKIGFSLTVKENKTAPVKGQLIMSKKVSLLFGLSSWFEIPCLGNGVGSCSYDDVCEHQIIKEGLCREMTPGAPEVCGCPFLKGNYTSKPVIYNVPAFPDDVPGYLLRGEFVAKVILSKKDRQLACYMASFYLEV